MDVGNQLHGRYYELKKRLQELNYPTSFGLDSCDTISQILHDLISTTESYKQLQDREKRLSADLAQAKSQLFPLRKENGKLIKENYQLNIEREELMVIINQNEEKYNREIKSLQEKFEDMNALSLYKDSQLADSEKRFHDLRDAYENIVSTKSNSSNDIKVKRFIDISSSSKNNTKSRKSLSPNHLFPNKTNRSNAAPSKNDTVHSENTNNQSVSISVGRRQDRQLQAEEENIITILRQQVEAANTSYVQLEEENRNLKYVLQLREEEIARNYENFNLKLERGYGVVEALGSGADQQSLSASHLTTQRIVEQLNSQIDFLNEQLAKKENDLNVNFKDQTELQHLRMECVFRGKQLEEQQQLNVQLGDRMNVLQRRVEAVMKLADVSTSLDDILVQREVRRTQVSGNSKQLLTQGGGAEDRLFRLEAWLGVGTGVGSGAEERAPEGLGQGLLRHRIKLLEASLGQLRDQLSVSDGRSKELAKTLSEKDDAILQLEVRNKALQETLSKYQHQQHDSENVFAVAATRNTALEIRVEELTSEKTYFEQSLAATTESFHKLNAEHNQLKFEYEGVTSRYQKLQIEVENYRQDLRKSSSETVTEKTENSRLTIQLDLLRSELQVERDNVSKLQLELSSLQQQYRDMSLNMDSVSSQNAELMHRLMRDGGDEDVVTMLKAELGKLRAESKHLQEVKHRVEMELQQMQHELSTLRRQEETRTVHLDQLQAENSGLKTQIMERDSEIEQLHTDIRELQFSAEKLDDALRHQQRTYENLSITENQMRVELKSKNDHIQELQSDVALLKSKVEDCASTILQANQSILQLQADNGSLEEQLHAVQQMNSSSSQSYSSYLQLHHRLEQENEILKLQLEKLSSTLSSTRTELQQAVEERNAHMNTIVQLKVLTSTMENSNQTQSSKFINIQNQVEDLKTTIQQVTAERTRLQEEVKNCKLKIEDLSEAVRLLDSERDNLQMQLDNHVEERERKKAYDGELQQRNEKLYADCQGYESRIHNLQSEIQSYSQQINVSESRISGLKAENSELRQSVSQRGVEVARLTEDLQLMTRENQALTSELSEVSSERDRLHSRIQELLRKLNETEQHKRALEIERSDLLTAYRQVLSEKRKLFADLESMSDSRQRLALTMQQLEGHVATLRGNVLSSQQAAEKWGLERSGLFKQVQDLNDRLVRAESENEHTSAEMRRLLQDATSLRQANQSLSERLHLVSQRSGSATESIRMLTARVSTAERDRDTLKELLHHERRRISEFEHLTNALRLHSIAVSGQDFLSISSVSHETPFTEQTVVPLRVQPSEPYDHTLVTRSALAFKSRSDSNTAVARPEGGQDQPLNPSPPISASAAQVLPSSTYLSSPSTDATYPQDTPSKIKKYSPPNNPVMRDPQVGDGLQDSNSSRVDLLLGIIGVEEESLLTDASG